MPKRWKKSKRQRAGRSISERVKARTACRHPVSFGPDQDLLTTEGFLEAAAESLEKKMGYQPERHPANDT